MRVDAGEYAREVFHQMQHLEGADRVKGAAIEGAVSVGEGEAQVFRRALGSSDAQHLGREVGSRPFRHVGREADCDRARAAAYLQHPVAEGEAARSFG